MKKRADVQETARFWQFRLTEWQKKIAGTPFVDYIVGKSIKQQR